MSSFEVGLVAFACIFGSALLGMLLRVYLPANHQSAETQRIVNLAAGIIGTMAALVLGLLIASAKGSYDAQNNELIAIAAKIGLIDRGLAVYGPDAQTSRDLLRSELDNAVRRLWPKGHPSGGHSALPGMLLISSTQPFRCSLPRATSNAQSRLRS